MGGGQDRMTTIVRQAQFVEDAHQELIWAIGEQWRNQIDNSPYSAHEPVDIVSAFFGIGYVLSNYPALFDLFGNYMAGVDVDAIYNRIFVDNTTGPIITGAVAEHAIELADDLEKEAIPRFETGMRDINAVNSSSFVIGRALIESTRIKAISKYREDLKFRMIPVTAEVFKEHLNWNKAVVEMYAQVMKLYISAKHDVDGQVMEFGAKEHLWNFTVLDNLRLAIGAATAGTRTTSDVVGGPTQTQKVLGGAMTGASVGAEVGGGWGALVGGIVGAGAGYFA